MFARPNPCVGAVLVVENRIIGEGCTSAYGGAHAEINALKSVRESDGKLLKKATLYVTLEPCSHFGKTPPCADAIIKYGIPKVVIGILDPNPRVLGRGKARLEAAGIAVSVGLEAVACKAHHKHFLVQQRFKRPYVCLKWAVSHDGFIAPSDWNKNRPFWISNAKSRQQVHQIRAAHQAILVGTNTAIKDNPRLDVRSTGGIAPRRLVLDPQLRLPNHLHLFTDGLPTWVLTAQKNIPKVHPSSKVVYHHLDFGRYFIKNLLDLLYRNNMQSLMVEGGAMTLQQFIDTDFWDEAVVFKGTPVLKKGVASPKIGDEYLVSEAFLGGDKMLIYRNRGEL